MRKKQRGEFEYGKEKEKQKKQSEKVATKKIDEKEECAEKNV